MLGPKPVRTLLALRRHPRASQETVRAFRARRLRRLVRHAYDSVPYYGRLFDAAGLDPADVRDVDDLRHLPVTTKSTLQGLPTEEIVARGVDPDRLMRRWSGGSTGEPFGVIRSWAEMRLLSAIRDRRMRELGQRRRDRVVTVKTLSTHTAGDRTLTGRILAALRPDRWQVVDSGQESEAIVAQVVAAGTTVLRGYPAQLAVIATEVDPSRLRRIGLRILCAGGEVLMPRQREQIEEGFGLPVHDSYASTEFDVLAEECPQGSGYHVNDDGLVLEVVRDGEPVAPGERGEVVGTGLHGYAMPLIRYAQGDLVRRGEDTCPCGSPFSVIRDLQGRVVEFFRRPDGSRIHPYEVFVPIWRKAGWIRRFQATQHSMERVVLQVFPAAPPSDDQIATVRRMFADHFGAGVRLDLELVEGFGERWAGKYQTYRSHVDGAG